MGVSTVSKSSATKIITPTGRVLSRLLVIAIIIISLTAWFGQIPEEFAYYQQRAISDNIALAPLYIGAIIGIRSLVKVIFFAMGILLYWRKPDDRIVILTSIFLIAFGSVGITFSNTVVDQTLYLGTGIRQLLTYITATFAWELLPVFIWLFPDGRLIPRWGILPIIISSLSVGSYLLPTDSPYFPLNWSAVLLFLDMVIIAGTPIIGQVYRYRNVSSPAQRQQTKFALYGFFFALAGFINIFAWQAALPDIFALGTPPYDILYLTSDIAFLGIPLALGFSLLHSRLWDIDLVINRSLVYGSIAALAIMIFFAVVAGLQIIIGQSQPLIAIIVAAAFSVVIFKPVRRQVQRFVDQRLYGLRFDLNELHIAQQHADITNPGTLTGKTLDGYEVQGVIGKGGMGEVYTGFGNGQIVAIKTMLPKIAADPEMRMRFQREAQAGQQLDHPHIARVYAYGEIDGTPYIVMDYVEGQDLSRYLKDGGVLDEETAAQLMTDICAALDMAHQHGFVHRDLKPGNIMIRPNGEAVLMDFGVTKVTDATSSLTGTGAIGTIDYMAPEQIAAAKSVDHRADIYALGVLLYEMLTGKKPFTGSPAQILFAHLQQPPPDPQDINPDIPDAFADAIQQAMAKNPADRFQNAGDFAAALTAG